ncbi:MAG TPA: tetratricopeptide repeat protein, partial [Chryseosolibacter sp.]|nr:tetratricopeptide repeat protein [Chryseosolibacter sp.]
QCSPNTAATGGSPGSAGLNMAKIMMEELSAVLAYMNGDFRKAEAHFHNAISIEEQNGHFFGPPEIMRPTQEFYGDFLLSRKKYKEAAAAFEKALDKAPGRTQSLIGLKTALQHLHDAEGAKKIASQLEKNLASAEVDKITTFFSTD